MTEHRRIVGLKIENFKRVRLVEISPGKHMNVVGGDNGAGKSSLLDAVATALGGARFCPDVAVRQGAERSEVVVDLGDIVVKWTKTERGQPLLSVQAAEGGKLKTPQAVLDGLASRLGYDPSKFLQMTPADQKAEMLRALGIDVSGLEAEHGTVYEGRADINRELKSTEALLASMEVDPEAPTEEVEPRLALAALGLYEMIDKAVEERALMQRRVDSIKEEIVHVREKYAALTEELAEADLEVHSVDMPVTPEQGREEAQAKVDEAEEINRQIEKNRSAQSIVERRDKLRGESETATKRLSAIAREKEELIAGAEFPVPGLSFDETGLKLDGVPFAQTAKSEQLRVAVAMSVASDPNLRVILFRDASLYDQENFEALRDMAEAYDLQVFAEVVGDDERATVLMSEGEVA